MNATTELVVTGSEAAAACGVDPFRTPVALWAEKLGLAPDRDETESMYWGSRLEPIMIEDLNKRHGYLTLASPGTITNPLFPWVTGTPDGSVVRSSDYPNGPEGVLEIKTTSPYRRGEWDDEQAPAHVVVQAHVYMLLTGLRWTLAAALIGGQKLVLREFEYDDEIAGIVLDKTREFLGYVERQEPPPPQGSDKSLFAKLYPAGTGEVVELTPELYRVCEQREKLRVQEKEVAEQKDALDAAILRELGSASIGMYDGRRVVTISDVERKGYQVEAKSYRQLRVKP